MLLQKWVYKYLFDTHMSIVLHIYPEMELLVNSIFNFLKN